MNQIGLPEYNGIVLERRPMFFMNQQGANVCQGSRLYIIQEGDSVASIAARFGVTAAQIMERNPYIDPENLVVNQPICIPEGERCVNCCPAGYGSGTVRYGQTYADILIENDVSYRAFRTANPRLSPTALIPGQRYCVPPKQGSPTCPNGTTRFTIPEGQTLRDLASNLRITQGRLLQLNETLAPSEFTAGRQICVPTDSLTRQ